MKNLCLLLLLFTSSNSFAGTLIAYHTGNWSARSTWVTTKTGTVTVSSGSTAVTGVGTLFTSELQIGDKIYRDGGAGFSVVGTVAAINSNTSITLTAGATAALSGSTLYSHAIPSSTDDVQIGYKGEAVTTTLTIDGNYSCNMLTFVQNGGVFYTVELPSGNSFTVAGTIYMAAAYTNGNTHQLNVSGTLNSTNVLLHGGTTNGSADRYSKLTIQNGGVANISGDIYIHNISLSACTVVSSVGTGRLNIGGNFISTTSSVSTATPYTPPPTITPGTAILAGTINFASTSVFNFNGTNKLQVLPVSATTTYGDLYLNNSGTNVATLAGNVTTTNVTGNIIVQSGIFSTQGASSSTTLNVASSNFTIAGNAVKTFKVDNGAFFKISGTYSFPSGFGTVTLQPTSTVDYIGTTQTIAPQNFGNLTISAGASAGRAVTLSSSGTIGVYTNFTPSSTNNVYTITGSTISFNGNQPQTLPSNFPTYTNLNVNNSSVTGIALSGLVTVNSILSFSLGKLFLGSNNLVIGSSGSVTGATATAYIVAAGAGVLTQQVIGGGTKTFPVGTAGHYTPATVALTAGSTTDNFSLRMLAGVYSGGETGTQQTMKGVSATWIVTEGTPGGSNVTLTLQWPVDLELSGFDRAMSRLTHYSNSAWEYGSMDIPASGSNPYSLSRSGFTSFSPFAVGMLNALPVRWLTFHGRNEHNDHYLYWKTKAEMNNSYFIVEASPNGSTFSEIGRVSGTLNTHPSRQHAFVHKNVSGKINYYRIKQVDNDGRSSYSSVIKVKESDQIASQIHFANHVITRVSGSVRTTSSGDVRMIISDVNGRIIYEQTHFLHKGVNGFNIDFTQPAGMYILHVVEMNGKKTSLKFFRN